MVEQFEAPKAAANTACDRHNALLKDCDLAGPGGAQGKAADAKGDQVVHNGLAVPNVNGVTEEQFMKTAPAVIRHELGLPKNASSKELVDKMLKDEIAVFKTEKPSVEKAQLKLFGFDDKQVNHFLHDKSAPNYDQELAAAWLRQSEKFMGVKGPATEGTYKKIENKWLKSQYQSALAVQKIHNLEVDKD